MLRLITLLLTLVLLPAAAAADNSLSFDAAIAIALREAPALSAQTYQVDVAQQAAIAAGALPDPSLLVGIDNFPIDGPDRFNLTRDFMTMRRIGVMQQFPNRLKRQARAAAARGQVALAEAEVQITRLNIARATATAWIARYSAEQQLAQLDALVAENQLLQAAVQAQRSGGRGMTTDVLLPQQEAAMIEERRDMLNSQRSQAIASLRRWIGAAAEQPLAGNAPDWPIATAALSANLHQHPEIKALAPKTQQLDAEIAAAQAEKNPDWGLELAYQERGNRYSQMISLQLNIGLPLFARSRQDPLIAAKYAERDALQAETEAMRREHGAALETSLASYQQLTRAVARQQHTLLPLADQKVTLALAAWRGGQGLLSTLIEARRERIDAEIKAIALEGERQQLAAHLYYSYGDPTGAVQ